MSFNYPKIDLNNLTLNAVINLFEETDGRMHYRFITDGTHLYKGDNPQQGTLLKYLSWRTHPESRPESVLQILKDQVKVIKSMQNNFSYQDLDHLIAFSLFLDLFNKHVIIKRNEKTYGKLNIGSEIEQLSQKIVDVTKRLESSFETLATDDERISSNASLDGIITNLTDVIKTNTQLLIGVTLSDKLKQIQNVQKNYEQNLARVKAHEIESQLEEIISQETSWDDLDNFLPPIFPHLDEATYKQLAKDDARQYDAARTATAEVTKIKQSLQACKKLINESLVTPEDIKKGNHVIVQGKILFIEGDITTSVKNSALAYLTSLKEKLQLSQNVRVAEIQLETWATHRNHEVFRQHLTQVKEWKKIVEGNPTLIREAASCGEHLVEIQKRIQFEDEGFDEIVNKLMEHNDASQAKADENLPFEDSTYTGYAQVEHLKSLIPEGYACDKTLTDEMNRYSAYLNFFKEAKPLQDFLAKAELACQNADKEAKLIQDYLTSTEVSEGLALLKDLVEKAEKSEASIYKNYLSAICSKIGLSFAKLLESRNEETLRQLSTSEFDLTSDQFNLLSGHRAEIVSLKSLITTIDSFSTSKSNNKISSELDRLLSKFVFEKSSINLLDSFISALNSESPQLKLEHFSLDKALAEKFGEHAYNWTLTKQLNALLQSHTSILVESTHQWVNMSSNLSEIAKQAERKKNQDLIGFLTNMQDFVIRIYHLQRWLAPAEYEKINTAVRTLTNVLYKFGGAQGTPSKAFDKSTKNASDFLAKHQLSEELPEHCYVSAEVKHAQEERLRYTRATLSLIKGYHNVDKILVNMRKTSVSDMETILEPLANS